MEPINYDTGPSPIAGVLQGLQTGFGVQQAQFTQQQEQAALQQGQQKLAAQQQQQQALSSLANNPNATASDYARVITMLPAAADGLKKAWDTKSADQQQSQLSNLSQWGSAIANGQPQVAADLMKQQADAMQNTYGPTADVKALRAQAQIVEHHPEYALGFVQSMLAAHPDGKKVADTLAGLGQENRAGQLQPSVLAKANADAGKAGVDAVVATVTAPDQIDAARLKNADVQSQIADRTNRFGLDSDKLETETKLKMQENAQKWGALPEATMAKADAATTDSIASQQSAVKMNDLAGRIEQAGTALGGGPMATVEEAFKRATGNTDEYTRLRNEFSRMVTPAAMSQYKRVASGSTSDKDIDTAMVGVPKPTDPAKMMASYLRGAANLQVYDSVLKNAESEWLGANKYLGKAAKDIEVDGVKVPAGTSFKEFTDKYIDAKVKAKIGQQTVQSRGYMRWATPQAGGAAGGF